MKTKLDKSKSRNKSSSPFFNSKNDPGFFNIQPKLKVGQPGDKYEVEADRVADEVVNSQSENQPFFAPTKTNSIQTKPNRFIQEKPLAESITPLVQRQEEEEEEVQAKLQEIAVQRQEEEEEEETLQMQPMEEEEEELQMQPIEEEEEMLQPKSDTSGQDTQSATEQLLNGSKGNGSPLNSEIQSQMEGSFGADFSGVKIHTDNTAVQLNKELGAQAFTIWNDIFFNEGKFSLGTKSGKQLLAHELTHTVQQGASNVERSRASSNLPNNEGVKSQAAERDAIISNEKTDSFESGTAKTLEQVSNKTDNSSVESQIEEQEATAPTESQTVSSSNLGEMQEQVPNLVDMGGSESQAAERDVNISNEKDVSSELNSGNEQEQISTESSSESATQQNQNSASQVQEENVVQQAESEIQNRIASIQQPHTGSEEQAEIEQYAESQNTEQQAQVYEQMGTTGELNLGGYNLKNAQQEQVATETFGTQNVRDESPLSNSVDTGSSSFSNSDAMSQILSSPNSLVKTQGIYLSQLIMTGRIISQEQIIQHGALQRQKVNQQFNGVQSGLLSFLNNNVALVQGFARSNTAIVTNVSFRTISKIVGAVMNAISNGEALSSTITSIIMGHFARVSSFVSTRVATIVGRIMNLVNSAPLPNIPGMQTIRNTVQNLVSRIAGVVQRALGTALGGIHHAYFTGISMLFTILNNLKTKVVQIMMGIIKVIMRTLTKIINALNGNLKKVVSILRGTLLGAVLPRLIILRVRMLQTINQLELVALQQIRNLEEENIESVASFVLAESGDGDGLAESMTGEMRSRQETIDTMKLNVARTMALFLLAVQMFKVQTSGIISLFVSSLLSLARRIRSSIMVFAGRVLSTIISVSGSVISIIEQIFNPVMVNIQNILQRTYRAVYRLLRSIISKIKIPVDKVVANAVRSLILVQNKIRRLVLRIQSF